MNSIRTFYDSKTLFCDSVVTDKCFFLRKMWFYLWALFLEGATAQHGPFALHVESKQLIGYDDLESARQKAEYVLAEGLAGASLSTLDLDDFNNLCCQVFASMPDLQYKMIVLMREHQTAVPGSNPEQGSRGTEFAPH